MLIKVLFFLLLISLPVGIIGFLAAGWAKNAVLNWLINWSEEQNKRFLRLESSLEKREREFDKVLEVFFENANRK